MSEYLTNNTSTACTMQCSQFEKCLKESSSNSNNAIDSLLKSYYHNMEEVDKRISKLEKNDKKYEKFLDASTKLNKTTRIVMICLCVVPLIQVIVFAAIVYHFGLENYLPRLLLWIVSGISVGSLIELIIAVITLINVPKSIDDIQGRLRELEKSNK